MTNDLMELNRETAMRLWGKSFGKQTRAIDFAGREIAKGAYNDRNSQYGWNVDHVLPQSKGGITADYNLVCCSIQTNDEKADRFPCFNANGCRFEIIKVQNHYEIRKTTPSDNEEFAKDNEKLNLYDSAAGIRFFKKLKGIQNKKRYVGYVLVRLQNLQNTAVIDFIEKVFEDENITFSLVRNYSIFNNLLPDNDEIRVTAVNYNVPLPEDTQNLLDKCILLNTYLSSYFIKKEYFKSYEILYFEDYCENKMDMYKGGNVFGSLNRQLGNTLYINDSVAENTEAKKKIDIRDGFNEYNYIYTDLSKNLKKEVDGK